MSDKYEKMVRIYITGQGTFGDSLVNAFIYFARYLDDYHENETCEWVRRDDGAYLTSEGHVYWAPNQLGKHGIEFCPYCGRRIVEVKEA